MTLLDEAKKHQIKLRYEAETLIKEFQLETLLDKYGQVTFTGSYVNNLMVHPDIDVEVVNPNIKKRHVIELAGTLFQTDGIHNAYLSDWNKRPPKTGRPKGYFVHTAIEYHNQSWRVDIWLYKDESFRGDERRDPAFADKNWFENTTETEREAMLLLKYQLFQDGLYPRPVESYQLYRAVLEGIRTRDQLRIWLQDNFKIGI